jgi:hypothetical protein
VGFRYAEEGDEADRLAAQFNGILNISKAQSPLRDEKLEIEIASSSLLVQTGARSVIVVPPLPV